MVGTKYRNNRPGSKDFGRIATIARCDEIAKTFTLMFDDGNGGTCVSSSTLKRWWKKVQEEATPQQEEDITKVVMEQKKELGIECPPITAIEVVQDENKASDGTSYSQVMQEIIQDGKNAVKQASKKQATKKPKIDVEDVVSKVEACVKKCKNLGIRRYEKSPRFVPLLHKDKAVGDLYIGNSKLVVSFPKRLAPEGFTPDRTPNCPYGMCYDFKSDKLDSFVELLTNIKFKEDK